MASTPIAHAYTFIDFRFSFTYSRVLLGSFYLLHSWYLFCLLLLLISTLWHYGERQKCCCCCCYCLLLLLWCLHTPAGLNFLFSSKNVRIIVGVVCIAFVCYFIFVHCFYVHSTFCFKIFSLLADFIYPHPPHVDYFRYNI